MEEPVRSRTQSCKAMKLKYDLRTDGFSNQAQIGNWTGHHFDTERVLAATVWCCTAGRSGSNLGTQRPDRDKLTSANGAVFRESDIWPGAEGKGAVINGVTLRTVRLGWKLQAKGPSNDVNVLGMSSDHVGISAVHFPVGMDGSQSSGLLRSFLALFWRSTRRRAVLPLLA